MKEVIMENSEIQISSVERNKAASALCKRLFPQWSFPPKQGELQKLIIESLKFQASEQEIEIAGKWWLWARDLAIENTFSRLTQNAMVTSALRLSLIHISEPTRPY